MMNSSISGQSREQLTEFMSAKMLCQLQSGFREVPLNKVKDVSCLEVFNNTLYVGTNDSKVHVFQLAKAKGDSHELVPTNERSFYPHCTSVHFIVAHSTFLIVVPLEEQQLIRIWNRENLQILHGYKGHAKQITSVIFLRDREHIASSSYDGTVRIWKISEKFEFDMEDKKYSCKYPLLTLVQMDVESVAFGGDDSFITIWNWSKDVVRFKCFAHPGSVISLSLCLPHYLFSIGGDSRIRAWRVEEQQRTHSNANEMLNEEIDDSKIMLVPIKQFNETVAQNVFPMHVSNHEILAIDSKGNTFLINRSLELMACHLKLHYSETIRSAKIWENRLLVTTRRKGRGEMKEIAGDFEEMVNLVSIPRDFLVITHPSTAKVQIQSKHSIFIQNEQTYKQIERVPDASFNSIP